MIGSLTEQRNSQLHAAKLSALQLAEGGADRALGWMRALPAPPSGADALDPFGGPQPMGAGNYTVTIDPHDSNPTAYLDLFTITVSGRETLTSLAQRVEVVLEAESFARYSYFTNLERLSSGTPIWFTGNDHLRGPVHSNAQFNISGSPVFDGPVASANSALNFRSPPPTGGNHPQFNGGLDLDASPVALPSSATALRIAAASSGGQWYEGNTTVEFALSRCGALPPPCLLVTNAARGWSASPTQLPGNGALFVNGGNVTVRGVLDGQLSIGTSHDIVIANNVTYAQNPQAAPSSNDILGLIAERNVIIASTAPTELTIQAAVMALNTSFTLENWWVGPPRSALHVYGGLIQTRRGPVGSVNGSTGQLLSGYSKDYWYDLRLADMAPPFFPTTGLFRQVLWRENP